MKSNSPQQMKKWMPWILVAVFAAWFLAGAQAPKLKNGFNVAGFGQLPVYRHTTGAQLTFNWALVAGISRRF